MDPRIIEILPDFRSFNEVLPYLNAHRNHLSMVDITYACDWVLDPGFIQKNAITKFLLTLPRAQQQQQPGHNGQQKHGHNEQQNIGQNGNEGQQRAGNDAQKLGEDEQQQHNDECQLCCSPYDSDAHFPVVLPCGHVVGAACLEELLKDTEDCFHCGATVFTRPAAALPLINPRDGNTLRGLLQSGRVFLEENKKILIPDNSYAAYYRWAYSRGSSQDSTMARLHAKEIIDNLEFSSRI